MKLNLMDVDELEDLAYRGAPMPDLNSQAQVLLFQSFRSLYRSASSLTREQGRREKQEILKAYQVNQFLESMWEQSNDMWLRIEAASAEYRKQPSIENADKLLKAIYEK